jgi:nucleotidyltransferase/DNA polymerase involved in DNA repair
MRAATKPHDLRTLTSLRNVGKAALADFKVLGIETVAQLAMKNADVLYVDLCHKTGTRHDPCVHDVFAATIHEAKTGEPINWWAYTKARKQRQLAGAFPSPA